MNVKKPSVLSVVICLYTTLCVFYFLPFRLDHKIVLPLLLLSVAALRLQSLPMFCAMIFSAAGDYAGASHNFLVQMSAFALAHISFIVYFSRIVLCGKHCYSVHSLVRSSLFASALFAIAVTVVLPSVKGMVITIGVAVYIVLIVLMFLLAGLTGLPAFQIGALLFVISDTILGWNKFVDRIPYSSYWILIPYFSAQILLFVQAAILHRGRTVRK